MNLDTLMASVLGSAGLLINLYYTYLIIRDGISRRDQPNLDQEYTMIPGWVQIALLLMMAAIGLYFHNVGCMVTGVVSFAVAFLWSVQVNILYVMVYKRVRGRPSSVYLERS